MKKHTAIAITLVAALALWRCSNNAGVQSVTRVDDLEITGTTDATDVVTARAGVRLTTPTTGPIFTSGTGSPNGVVTATLGSLYLRTDTAEVYQNTDGVQAWSQVGGGGGGASSLGPVTFDRQLTGNHCSVDMAVTSETDWMWFPSAATESVNGPGSFDTAVGSLLNVRHKRNSVRLWRGAYFVFGGAAVTFNSVGYAAPPGISASAADSSSGAALTNAAINFTMSGASTSGHGVAWDMPMHAGETGTFAFCTSLVNNGLTVTATTLDGATTTNTIAVIADGTRRYALVQIPFTIGSETQLSIEIVAQGTTGANEFGPLYAYF